MLRREFCINSCLVLAAAAFLRTRASVPCRAEPPGPEEEPWIQGSPYLGHADYRLQFRGLPPAEAWKQIVHFRTAEPWRRKRLFKL
jgi:hypothetical protein